MIEGAPLLDQLAERAAALVRPDRRAILGLTGCPGAGKSTLAERLAAALDPDGEWVARLPMDGFHLADAALDRLGRRQWKGAIDTFDGWGYLALLRRLHAELDHDVYAPDFERTLEQPIAGAIAIRPSVRLVITEGNYLLAAAPPWSLVRRELDEAWYVELDDRSRLDRLRARHVAFGKSPERAREWVARVDEPNAALIRSTRDQADLVIDMASMTLD